MSEFSLKIIKLAHCDFSETDFDIFIDRYAKNRNKIKTSFQKPIIAISKKKSYEIVYGFKKANFLLNSNKKTVPAFVLSDNLRISEIIKTILIYHKQEFDFRIPEIKRIIKLLKYHKIDNAKIKNVYLPLLNLPPKKEIIFTYLSLRINDKSLISYLCSKNADLKFWKFLSDQAYELQEFSVKLIKSLHPSLSVLKEITNNLYEISRRDEVKAPKLVKALDLENFLNGTNRNRNIMKIRKIIKQKRYPKLSQKKQQIATLLEQLKTPQNLRIVPDKTLETKSFFLNAAINSKHDLEMLKKFLEEREANLVELINRL